MTEKISRTEVWLFDASRKIELYCTCSQKLDYEFTETTIIVAPCAECIDRAIEENRQDYKLGFAAGSLLPESCPKMPVGADFAPPDKFLQKTGLKPKKRQK